MTWEPQGLGLTIFQDRYARFEGETWAQACKRVATHVAAAEDNGKAQKYGDRFEQELVDNRFMPGGRIWYGSGRPKAQLLNCFVVPTADSREGWGKTISDVIVVSGTGGGVGINCSPVRPRGSDIKGTGGKATGAVSLMQMIDRVGDVLVSGGGRRLALMLCLDVNHPDIEEFLNVKLNLNELNNANISVVLNMESNEFVSSVREGKDIELVFGGRSTGATINARDLWDGIVKNAWTSGEPGVLNGFEANRTNNISYYKPLVSTNPCITGDTYIAVADGRNVVTIEQLTKEGKDVPVYCSDPITGQTVIRMGRNPRLTGKKKEVWRLRLDDGTWLDATPDHQIMLNDGSYKELRNLIAGESLRPFNSYESNGYRQIADSGVDVGRGGKRRSRRQYRLIYEFQNGSIPDGMNLHHVDFNKRNDRLENLLLMTEKDHQRFHSERMEGDKNPYFKMDDSWKFKFASHPGEKNPKYIPVSNDELIGHGRQCWIDNDWRLSQSIWARYAKGHGLPQFLGNQFRFGSFTDFKLAVQSNHKVVSVEFKGYEDVYDLTVDEHHNYHVATSSDGYGIRCSGITVHNCGEIWLEEYGCCCLGALVLPRFVANGSFDWDALDESIRLGTRFLDDVLTVNHYPIPEIKENCETVRRIGLGVMGLHTMLLQLGYKYSGDDGRAFIDKLFGFIKNTAYDSSINLAIEKGPFPAYDGRYLESGFVKTLKRGIRNKIKEYGIRNCASLTIAPTGTTGMVAGVSTGIEPLFAPVYWRHYFKPTNDGNKELAKELVVTPEFQQFGDLAEGAYDVEVSNHFEIQKIVQAHIDNAVSKTINLPKDYPVGQLSDIWLSYLPYLKGSTFYRQGSREFEPLEPVRLEDAIKMSHNPRRFEFYKAATVESNQADLNSMDCPDGSCSLDAWKVEHAEAVS
jgi:ribonucleotide reductase alpha subunit